jgi:hypothetical protein
MKYMKSTIVEKVIFNILIGATIFFGWGNSTNVETKKSEETVLNNSEIDNSKLKIDIEELNLKDFERKTLGDLDIVADKLSKDGADASIDSILSEYYELNKKNSANIFYAKESGEFYLNPKQSVPKEYDPRKRAWYIETMKNTSYVSKQYTDVVSGRNIVTIARIVSRDNITIGVIGVDKIIN